MSSRRLKRSPHGMPVGEAHHAAKMTEAQVRELRRLHYELELCMKCAAILVGVRPQTAFDAITFRTWRHVQ